MPLRRPRLLALTLLLSGSACATSPPAGDAPGQQATALYQQLQTAVRHDDAAAVAQLVRYPLLTGNDSNRADGKPLLIKTPAQLRAHYHQIFTATIKQLLACRSAADMVSEGNQLVIGNGSIWLADSFRSGNGVSRPLNSAADDPQKTFKVVAVYDGAHAADDIKTCETAQ